MYPALYEQPAPSPANPAANPAWHDRSIFEVMWAAREPLLILAILGGLLGAGIWLARPSVYEAAAQVYVNRPSADGNRDPFRSGGATAAGPSAQEAVMKSAAVLSAVLDQPGISEGPLLSRKSDPLAHLTKKLRISVDEDKETFTLRFRSTDPQEASDVVNAVVAQYIQTQRNRANMQLGSATNNDPTNNTPAPAFAVNVASREMMSRLAEQQLSRLSQEIIDASLELEAAQGRATAAEEIRGDANALLQLAMEDPGKVQYDPTAIELIRRIEVAYNTAQTRYRAAENVLGPQHPAYRTYASNVEVLGIQLTDAREAAAINLIETFEKSQQQAQVRLDRLQQRVAATRTAALQIDQLAIEVLASATPPRKPVAPKLAVHTAVGILTGLMLGTLLGLIGEVRRVADMHEQAGNAPAPGGFMHVTENQPPPAAQLGWDRPAPATDAPPLLGTIPRIAATHRLVGPGYDRAADSVHQVRAVLQAIARQQEIKSIAFVSPRRGTGRTSVTIGVASSLATAGTRVLAVDADLSGRIARRQQANAQKQNPQQPQRPDTNLASMAEHSGHFAAPPQPGPDATQHHNGQTHNPDNDPQNPGPLGIAGFLDGEPLDDCVKRASSDCLAFLPANTAQERHLGIFSDRKIADLIEQTRDHFDLILFDSGPVPGSLESLTIASVADAVVLVLEESHDIAEYQRTLQHLRVINAKILGVIINKANHASDETALPAPDANGQTTDAQGQTGPAFAAAGSGILAASVFTDAQAGHQEQDWELTAVNDLLPDDDLPDLETKKS